MKKKTAPKKHAAPGKRSHHSPRSDEVAVRAGRRRVAAFRKNPPLVRPCPSIASIRDALDAAGTSLPAALHLGWLVHCLKRSAICGWDDDLCGFDPDGWKDEIAMSGNNLSRLPGVRELLKLNEEDIDLSPRYKTLMRYKRLYERFARAVGHDPDEDPAALFADDPPPPLRAAAAAARAILSRCGGTTASLRAALAPRSDIA